MREAVRSGSLEASVPIEEASRAGAAVVSLRVRLKTPDLQVSTCVFPGFEP